MQTRQEAIQYCHSFQDVYEDYPFHDDNWCVMRHKGNKKTFALIYDKDGYVWINVKCDPEWREFWRNCPGLSHEQNTLEFYYPGWLCSG